MITEQDAWKIVSRSVESGFADDDVKNLIENLQWILEEQKKKTQPRI